MNLNIAVGEFLKGYFSTNERRDKTRQAYVSDLGQFETFIGKTTNLLSIKNTDIERWVSHLKGIYSPASLRRKIVTAKVFFTYWIRRDVLTESPFWKVK
jgi:integrase/recombinase XerD